jgi:hypothetical protein
MRLFLPLMLLLVLPATGHTQRPLKVYISMDMEGLAGVVTGEQLGPPGSSISGSANS